MKIDRINYEFPFQKYIGNQNIDTRIEKRRFIRFQTKKGRKERKREEGRGEQEESGRKWKKIARKKTFYRSVSRKTMTLVTNTISYACQPINRESYDIYRHHHLQLRHHNHHLHRYYYHRHHHQYYHQYHYRRRQSVYTSIDNPSIEYLERHLTEENVDEETKSRVIETAENDFALGSTSSQCYQYDKEKIIVQQISFFFSYSFFFFFFLEFKWNSNRIILLFQKSTQCIAVHDDTAISSRVKSFSSHISYLMFIILNSLSHWQWDLTMPIIWNHFNQKKYFPWNGTQWFIYQYINHFNFFFSFRIYFYDFKQHKR